MLIQSPKSWQLPESAATDESDYESRRSIVKKLGLGAVGAALPLGNLDAATAIPDKPNINKKYVIKDRKPTPYPYVTGYNNFYEFTTDKLQVRTEANKGWKTEPWTLEVGGHVTKPLKIDVNDLCKEMGIEMRVYRFRCVEAWSMVIPWDGFPLSKLIKKVEPTEKAKYVKFTTFEDRKAAPGFDRYPHYDWPYTEGLRLDEANHDLTFLAAGVYGKPIPNQNGAPLRLVVPWKYGFKSIKSLVRIDFTEEQPNTLWNSAMPKEYGFYSNVNPKVSHPRWSQATERVIGGKTFGERIETFMFNGYEKEVAGLYKGMDLEKFY